LIKRKQLIFMVHRFDTFLSIFAMIKIVIALKRVVKRGSTEEREIKLNFTMNVRFLTYNS
jgi:hypothetical protein